MKKRLLAVILSLSMLCAFTACGQNGVQKESVNAGFVSSESKASTDKEEVANEEPITITMGIFDRGSYSGFINVNAGDSVIDNRFVNLMKEAVLEELNINLEYVAIPRSEEITKIQTLMAAKNEPDIFFTYSSDQFLMWTEDGALADLTEYVNNTEEGQALSEFLGDSVMEYGQVDGKQYAINGVAYSRSQLSSFIRKDLVEAVGMELIEVNDHYAMTPSMLEEALIKIKEAGYCEYPFGLLNLWQCLSPINGAFVNDAAFDSPEQLIQNAEDTFFLLDGTKDAYRFLNECYNEGLIHPDFPLYKESNLGEMIAAGECAFWSYAAWKWLGTDGSLEKLYDVQPSAEVVAVEIVQEDQSPARYYKASPVASWGMVSSNCENVEAAVRLISWLNTSETAHMLTSHGIEGETYTVDKDGDKTFIDGSYFKGNQDMNMWLNSCPCQMEAEDTIRAYRKNNPANNEKNLIAYGDAYMIATSEGKEYRILPSAVIEASNEWATSLAENKDNLIIGSITSTIDKFDEVYDRYFEVYMEEGGSQVAEERLATLQQ